MKVPNVVLKQTGAYASKAPHRVCVVVCIFTLLVSELAEWHPAKNVSGVGT